MYMFSKHSLKVNWVGVPLLDLLLGPADVPLDAPPGAALLYTGADRAGAGDNVGGDYASLLVASLAAGAAAANGASVDSISNSSSSSSSSSSSNGSSSSSSRGGRRKREKAAAAHPPFAFPVVEGEVAPGLVLPPQPAHLTR
jgi:hypothetical protein